jgi:hypothetical protein
MSKNSANVRLAQIMLFVRAGARYVNATGAHA